MSLERKEDLYKYVAIFNSFLQSGTINKWRQDRLGPISQLFEPPLVFIIYLIVISSMLHLVCLSSVMKSFRGGSGILVFYFYLYFRLSPIQQLLEPPLVFIIFSSNIIYIKLYLSFVIKSFGTEGAGHALYFYLYLFIIKVEGGK